MTQREIRDQVLRHFYDNRKTSSTIQGHSIAEATGIEYGDVIEACLYWDGKQFIDGRYTQPQNKSPYYIGRITSEGIDHVEDGA